MLLLPLFVRKCWLSCGLVVFILLFHLSLGRAADLTVTTTTDVVDGDVSSPQALEANPGPDGISLREAVLAVNNAVGPHTITFVAALAGQTINITSPLLITRDGITLTGLSTPDGQPNITLDGVNILHSLEFNSLLFVYASDFTLTRLRITRVQNHAIEIMAGQRLYHPPSPPSEVRNIRIEDNVFDNTGLDYPLGDGDAIRIWMEPTGIPADASITNVKIVHNTFRHFQGTGGSSGVGVIISPFGTNCVIRDVVIEGNIFDETLYPIEVSTAAGSNNRIIGTRIIGNTFRNGINPVVIGNVAAVPSKPPTSESVIDDTVIRDNKFFTESGSITIAGGHGPSSTNIGGQTYASANVVRNVEIINNLIVTGSGINIHGGKWWGATGNRVEGVQVINNTIITHPQAGVRVFSDYEGGTGNSVTGVSVLNTIFQKRDPNASRPEDVIAGEVTPDQVRFSIISMSGFSGVNGNISADPKFVNPNFANPGEGDFHLQPGSPAIDAGTSNGAPSTDLEGRPRHDDPSTPNTGEGAVRYYDIGAFEYGSPQALCTYTLSPENYGFSPSSGTGSITVAASSSSCSWTASSNVSWITITSGSSGTSSGTIGYTVASNSGLARTGTMTIGGQTFTVTQASANAYLDTVQKIFIGYYQRPADPGGLIYWADRLNKSGGNLSEIIEAFANSAEAQTLYGTINSSNISNVVNGIYIALFSRPAEPGGLDYYSSGFNAGQFTAATIMLNVLYGATQGNDYQSVVNKLTAANLFTQTIDPELDGKNFQVTYAGNDDVIAARNFLTLYATPVKVPTQAETTAYIKANIANTGDIILSQ